MLFCSLSNRGADYVGDAKPCALGLGTDPAVAPTEITFDLKGVPTPQPPVFRFQHFDSNIILSGQNRRELSEARPFLNRRLWLPERPT